MSNAVLDITERPDTQMATGHGVALRAKENPLKHSYT